MPGVTSPLFFSSPQLGRTVAVDQMTDIWEEEEEEEDRDTETSRHHNSHGAVEENVIQPLPSLSPPVNSGPKWFPSMVISDLFTIFVLYTNILFVSEINDDG